MAHVFLDDEATEDTVSVFEDAAKELRGDIAFVRYVIDSGALLAMYWVSFETAFVRYVIDSGALLAMN